MEQLKACLDVGDRGNKRRMAEKIAAEYPVLWNQVNKENSNKNLRPALRGCSPWLSLLR